MLGTYRSWRNRCFRSPRVLVGVGVAALAALLPGALLAQEAGGPKLPVLEPRLTRIIGSDTLKIVEPALSPDGQWVVFSTWNGVGEGYLFIVSSRGGEPRRLIATRNVRDPQWFPDGARLAYWSEEGSAIMSVPFDSRSGTAAGPAQRVTVESAAFWYEISPDGRWIAYRRWTSEGSSMRMEVRVVASNGGVARTVGDSADMIFLTDWSADGRYVYYRARLSGSQDVARMFRAAVDGGRAEEVVSAPSGPSAPRLPYRVVDLSNDGHGQAPFEVQTYDGSPLARIALPNRAGPAQRGRGFTTDGRRLVAVASNQISLVRVVPVAGGERRQLGDARADERPLGWSPDGSEILFAATLNGRSAIMAVPARGGAAREIGPMPDLGPAQPDAWMAPITFSQDGRFLTYSKPNAGDKDRTLVIRGVSGGPERVITTSAAFHMALRLVGPGGTPNRAGRDFLYLERAGDRVDLRAIAPEGGTSRLLRSFASTDVGLGHAKGVFGDWVAYPQFDGDGVGMGSTDPDNHPARLVIARGPGGTPREVAALPGVIAFDDVAWSPDGRWIAAVTFVNEDTDYIKVLLVGVTPEGEVSSPPRLIDTGTVGSAWSLQWLPDGSAVTLYGQNPAREGGFDVFLVPVRSGGRALPLTRDDPDNVVVNLLSPDGGYVAYQARVDRGTSLWLADFGEGLTSLRRRDGERGTVR